MLRAFQLRLALAALLTLALAAPSLAAPRADLRQLLAAQGFTGELKHGDVRLDELGSFRCGGQSLRVVYYQHTDTRGDLLARQQQHRILFLSADNYLGSFELDERPTSIADGQIRFAHPLAHDEFIRCDARGLPTSAMLDGRSTPLAK